MRQVLPLFSYLFHPLFVSVYATLLFLFGVENYLAIPEKLLVVIQVVIITVLIPIAFYFLLKSLGKIDSVMAYDLRQRKLPLTMQALLFFFLLRQNFMMDRIPELYFFFIGALASTFIALLLILFKFKASLHMLAMASLLSFVVAASYAARENHIFLIASLFIATGLVASSRLYMKAHSGIELTIGFLSGLIPQVSLWYFWL